MEKINESGIFRYSNENVKVHWVKNVNNYKVDGTAIVVNIGMIKAPYVKEEEIEILKKHNKVLNRWESAIFTNVTIKSAELILVIKSISLGKPDFFNKYTGFAPALQSKDLSRQEFIVNEKAREEINKGKWEYAGDLYPAVKGMLLWQTKEELIDLIGPFNLDPYYLTGQSDKEEESRKIPFNIKCYLWFAPQQSHCGIHNNHKYIEIHTQVSGIGYLPKFLQQDATTIYEDYRMAPGYSTTKPFCVVIPDETEASKVQFIYPWHEYYAETDCVWLVAEYHPAEE
jgi:hypothetical protein